MYNKRFFQKTFALAATACLLLAGALFVHNRLDALSDRSYSRDHSVEASRVSFVQALRHAFFKEKPVRDGTVEMALAVSENLNSEAVAGLRWTVSRPCCVDMGVNRHDCFFRIRKNTISHMIQIKGESSIWENLGGYSSSDIGCLSWGASYLFVFQLAFNNTLMGRTFTEDGWSYWQALPSGGLREIPSCVVIKPGFVQCMGRSLQGHPVSVQFSRGTWKAKQVPNQTLAKPISCISSSSDRMDCFAKGDSRQMQQASWKLGSGWNSWTSLGGSCNGTASPVVTGSGHMTVFVKSSLARVASIVWNGSDWGPWKFLNMWGPPLATDVECVASIGERIDCFAAFKPRWRLHRIYWNGYQWSKWILYDYTLSDKPICRFHEDKRIYCLLLAHPPKWTLTSFQLVSLPTKNLAIT